MSNPEASTESGIDRRDLLRAGAWAAPVVLIAATVPSATASDGDVPFAALSGTLQVEDSSIFGSDGPIIATAQLSATSPTETLPASFVIPWELQGRATGQPVWTMLAYDDAPLAGTASGAQTTRQIQIEHDDLPDGIDEFRIYAYGSDTSGQLGDVTGIA